LAINRIRTISAVLFFVFLSLVTGPDLAVLDLVDADGKPKPAAIARFLLTRPHHIPQLVRLARGTNEATRRAAQAALEAIRAL